MSWKRCKIEGKVHSIHTQEVADGLSMVPKLMTLNDLERPNGRYFALFHRIRQLLGAITSPSFKLEPYCLQQNVDQRIYSSTIYDVGDILRDNSETVHQREVSPLDLWNIARPSQQ